MPKLPEFKSEEELAEFVDTHDTSDYWDEMVSVSPRRFRVKRRQRTAVRVPLTRSACAELKQVAETQGIALEVLLRQWVSQRLKQERKPVV